MFDENSESIEDIIEKQVFPKSISKEEVFNTATDEVQRDIDKANRMLVTKLNFI